jgi:Spo0E like sporulation regulatory protein
VKLKALERIEERIEELRIHMLKIASDKDLTDPRVVRVSEMLDVLIIECYTAEKR